MEYLVTWSIEIESDTPEDAAKLALEIQRDKTSLATCFLVKDPTGKIVSIDLE